jgi:hypothetical protein
MGIPVIGLENFGSIMLKLIGELLLNSVDEEGVPQTLTW